MKYNKVTQAGALMMGPVILLGAIGGTASSAKTLAVNFGASPSSNLLVPRRKLQASVLSSREKRLIDCLALKLQNDTELTGLIKIDRERRSGEHPDLMELVIVYLNTAHAGVASRVAVMGAFRLSREMELFTIRGEEMPTPFPQPKSGKRCRR